MLASIQMRSVVGGLCMTRIFAFYILILLMVRDRDFSVEDLQVCGVWFHVVFDDLYFVVRSTISPGHSPGHCA